MNLNSRRVGGALIVLLVALLVNLTVVQFFQGPSLSTDTANRRQLLAEYSRQRGPIVVAGNSIAQSVATDDSLKFLRQYPGGTAYAPLTGFYSLYYGTSGIEQAENGVLSGNDDRLFGTRINDILTGRDPKGGRVDLTINPQAQKAAFDGLTAAGAGAVVAIDPTTGAILAAVSTPSFDPSKLSSHDPNAIEAYYEQLSSDPAKPLLNRAFNQTYPPGSTFKVVVSAAALADGKKPDTEIPSPTTYKLPDSDQTLSNFEGESCGNTTITLQQALTISCNTAFAIEGVDLGRDTLAAMAKQFGFDTGQQEVPLPVTGSTIGPVVDDASLAQTSIGQRDVRMTPLQGALIAATVANRGVQMQPYLVARELAPDLSVIDEAEPQERSTVMTPDQADDLGRMMVSVVASGTGRKAAIDGVTVAGKTGTADTGFTSDDGSKPDAWFIGYAPAASAKIAVAVIVEGAGSTTDESTGGDRSAPIAKAVMQAYLASPGRVVDVGQPRTFGERYEIGELIGYGGMAEVHKGRDVRLGREVAIKVLRSDLARDPSFQTRFRREAQAAARLNHPSIVAVYDTGEDIGPSGAVPYIVMEFIEGRTLRDVLRAEGSLQATRAMEIVAEICSALDYSHRAGIVHRDIKPANVMITRTGSVKVMDFGIARAIADDAATVTQTAAVIGTAQYLSPEQARGESVDARSDVYSTGCLLYELVTGRPPFVGDSPVAVAYQHVREVPPLPSTLNPDIPRALDSVTMKALAKNPQNRYQSAGDMGADLSRILADQPVRAETALTDEERTQFIARPGAVAAAGVGGIGFDDDDRDDSGSGRRGVIVWAAVVAALLVVIVGVAYLVLRNTDKTPEQATVPLVVGKTQDQAANALRQAGFMVAADPAVSNGPCGDGGSTFPNVAEGNVCTQSIPNGTRKDVDTTISFTIYMAGTVNVPPVLGLQFTDAQGQLVALGFNVTPQTVHNAQKAGTVVAQNPLGNTAAAKGANVTLSVSDGQLQIPEGLVGKTLTEVLAALNTAGFTTDITETPQDTADPTKDNIVLSVQPTPGVFVNPGTPIAIVYARYVAPVTPPATCTTPGSTPTGTPTPGSTPLPPCTSATPTRTGSRTGTPSGTPGG